MNIRRLGLSRSLSATLSSNDSAREQWHSSYRLARIIEASKPSYRPALSRLRGVEWLAHVVVSHDRNAIDPLSFSATEDLIAKRVIDEVLAEESQ